MLGELSCEFGEFGEFGELFRTTMVSSKVWQASYLLMVRPVGYRSLV